MEALRDSGHGAVSASSYPPAPWEASGRVAFIRYFADAETMRKHIPYPLELVTPLMNRTAAGYCVGMFDRGLDGESKRWAQLWFVAGEVVYGSRRGYYVSHCLTDDPGAFRGDADIYGLDVRMASCRQKIVGRSQELSVNAGARFQAEFAIRPVLPAPVRTRELTFFTFVGGRLHEWVVQMTGTESLATSRVHIGSNAIAFGKPTVKQSTHLWNCTAVVFGEPRDIDLRGFRPKPDEEVWVED